MTSVKMIRSTIAAPAPVVQTTPAAEVAERIAPFYYEITGEGPGVLHVIGTVHISYDADADLAPFVWDRFKASDTFVMETDVAQAQSQMATAMLLPKGQSLEQLLGEQAWAELDKRLKGSAAQYKGFKPWFVVSLLLLQMLPEGADLSASMDHLFHKRASAAGKNLAYLEPASLQIKILEETMGPEDLKEMLLDFETQKQDLATMIQAYREGDEAKIMEMSFKELGEKPERYELLFFSRNEAWVPQLEEHLKRGEQTFVAFGAGHLFGERGVLELMKARGYKVNRVKTLPAAAP